MSKTCRLQAWTQGEARLELVLFQCHPMSSRVLGGLHNDAFPSPSHDRPCSPLSSPDAKQSDAWQHTLGTEAHACHLATCCPVLQGKGASAEESPPQMAEAFFANMFNAGVRRSTPLWSLLQANRSLSPRLLRLSFCSACQDRETAGSAREAAQRSARHGALCLRPAEPEGPKSEGECHSCQSV